MIQYIKNKIVFKKGCITIKKEYFLNFKFLI